MWVLIGDGAPVLNLNENYARLQPMSKKCSVSGKTRQVGNRVSHANNRTSHAFKPNIQTKAIFLPGLKKTVRVNISTRIIRTIDKLGLEETLRKFGMTEADLVA